MYSVHKTRAKDITPESKSTVNLVPYMSSISFLVASRNIFCYVDVTVLAEDVDFWGFWVHEGGGWHVASCRSAEERLEAASHPRVTLNSLDLPSSPPACSGLSVSPLTKMEEVLISPGKDGRFTTAVVPKPRLGSHLPCSTIMISFHISKMANHSFWLLFK